MMMIFIVQNIEGWRFIIHDVQVDKKAGGRAGSDDVVTYTVLTAGTW